MIQDLDTEQASCLAQSCCQSTVLSTRLWVTTGVIVHTDDCRRGVTNRHVKNLARMHHTGGEGALRHHHILDDLIFLVQEDDLELLTLQPREQWHIILGNVAAGAKLYQPTPLARQPPPSQLKRRLDLAGLCRPNALHLAKFVDAGTTDRLKVFVKHRENTPCQVNRRGATGIVPSAQHNGEQLHIRQGVFTMLLQALTRPLVFWPVFDPPAV